MTSAFALRSRIALLALAATLLLAASASATTGSSFKLMNQSGTTRSLSFLGYTFLSRNPKVGKSGKVQVDVLIHSSAERAFLKKGPVKAATLRMVTSDGLSAPKTKTYKFKGAKITSVKFETGISGPSAVIDLSYSRLA